MTRQCRDVPLDASLEGTWPAEHPTAVVPQGMCQVAAVNCPHENRRKTQGTETQAGSTQWDEGNAVMTNLVVVEMSSGRVRRHLSLCDREN